MDRARQRFQRGIFAAAIGAVIVAALGCVSAGDSKSPPPPAGSAIPLFPRASRPLDPAIESNWPQNWNSPAHGGNLFASFVRHAEMSPEWLLLSWRGEAVFVRADPKNIEIEFQDDSSNKIERLTVSGPCETLSLRMYVPAEKLEYDLEASKLALWKTSGRSNPAFSSPGQSSP